METAISIVSCLTGVGSLIVAIIALIRENKTKKEVTFLKNIYEKNSIIQNINNNSGINVGINGGTINEKGRK